MSATLFGIEGRIAVITGATGELGKTMARALAAAGARVAVMSRTQSKADTLAEAISAEGGEALALAVDVTDRAQVEAAADAVQSVWGRVDILVNSAGGNHPDATTGPDKRFFDLPSEALEYVMKLNLLGTVFPCQVFGRLMAGQKEGCIVNISSMAAMRPLTRVFGYAATKAGIDNFTRWFAVHMAQEYATSIRVNAIAPGFFETSQNRFLLRDPETKELSERGKKIIDHTPMGRFGDPEDLIGALLFLASPAASFVTGIVIPVDGGFSAYGGV